MKADIIMADGYWQFTIREPEWLVREIVRQMELGAVFCLLDSRTASVADGQLSLRTIYTSITARLRPAQKQSQES